MCPLLYGRVSVHGGVSVHGYGSVRIAIAQAVPTEKNKVGDRRMSGRKRSRGMMAYAFHYWRHVIAEESLLPPPEEVGHPFGRIKSNHVHYLLEHDEHRDLQSIMHWVNWYSAMCFNCMLRRTNHFGEQRGVALLAYSA